MLKDLEVAARRLRQDPWTAATAVLVCALGAGLNTAVFAFAYGVLVRPLPYGDVRSLAVVGLSVRLDRLEDWRGQLTSFEQIAGYATEGVTIRGLPEPRFVPAAVVTDTFFTTLDSAPSAGRTFGPADPAAVAVISARLARQSGVSIENLLGRSITAGQAAVTIVGVMPDAFAVPAAGTDVWVSARAMAPIAFDRTRDARRFRLIGRVRRGLTLPQVREDVQQAGQALDPSSEKTSTLGPPVASLYDTLVGPVRPVLLAFTAAAGLVLFIACANVATILMGRTIGRQRELAIRSALGASQARLFMTTLSESVLIVLSGTALGAVLAVGAVRVVGTWAVGILPRLSDVRVDGSVLAFALVVAALSSLMAAIPTLRVVRWGSTALHVGRGSPPGSRVRALLAVCQIALAVVLLAAGGLLARTIIRLLGAPTGVEARGAIVSQLMVTDAMGFGATGEPQRMAALLARVRGLPGTTAAGAGSSLPPDNAPIAITVRLGTAPVSAEMALTSVTPGYLEALGVPLLRGRYFEDTDDSRADLVAVLSESAVRAVSPNDDPVGRPLPMNLPGLRERGRATVLGVVADVKYGGLESNAGPAIYVLWKELPASQLYLAVRTTGDALAAAPALRTTLRENAPRVPVMPIRRLDEVLQRSVADRWLRAWLGGSVALLAFAIALAGLAGGLGRVVSERRYELAIRAALGATPAEALQMIMTQGATLAASGITIGTLAALAVGTTLRSLLHGVSPYDPATLGAVAAFVAGTSMLACYLPARRAARANPLDTLRDV